MLKRLSTRNAGALLAVAACSLALGACGDDETTASGSSSDSAESSSANDQDTARVRLQECLRENGVDVGTPGEGQANPQDIDRDELEKAMEACTELRQEAFGDADIDQDELQDAAAKFTQCMRDEGIDVPDMNFGDGRPADGEQLDQDDPDVKAALEACQDELPEGPGGGTP